MEMLNWPNQSCFFLVSYKFLFLFLIPTLDSCKSQLVFTRNVDCLFPSRRCRHVLRTLPHAAFPFVVISNRTLSAFIPLKSDMKMIFISPVQPSQKHCITGIKESGLISYR